MSFAEKGAVGDIDPALFIGYLHRQNVTGTLKFEEGAIQRAIYFREGRVLFSSSNAPEDQLGAILVAAGKIGQAQFDAIVAALEPKQSIAAALSQGGHVSQRDIGDAARRKVEQIVGSCCVQAGGQYEFEDGVLPKGALDLKLTTERVLVSAFEGLEPSGFLSRILKSPMAVLTAADVVPTDPELARLRQALDGVSSLADIGGMVGLSLAATEARAAVLVVLGAARVLTSQIEEMSLPDTGEESLEAPDPGPSDDSDPVEAETIAFQHSPVETGTISFGQASASGLDAAIGGDEEAAPDSGGPGRDVSADETISMDGGSGVPAPANPSQSGAVGVGIGGKRERASNQDLAAVKELLGSPPAGPSRPGSASIPSQRWDPMLSSQGRPGRDHTTAGESLRSPILRSVFAVALLAVVVVGGWIAYTSQNTPAPRPVVSVPGPTPLPTIQVAGGSASPAEAPSSSVTALPSPSEATKATPAPAAAKSAITPIPATTPAPTAAEKPTPAPAPKATATPAPVVAVRATPAIPPSGGSYDALKAGRLAEAAAGFESIAQSHSAEFSVQLLVACSPQTIEKAIQNDPSTDLFIVPATIAGKPCHRLMRGFFKTIDDATHAVTALPGYYVAEGAKPRAVPVKSVLR